MLLDTASPTAVLVWLATGVFLLLYGVRLLSDALQRVINGRMQQAVTRLLDHPLAAFGVGVVGTALVQSSTAIASLLIELVSAGFLSLSVAIVMVFGANVGSTLVVQLLALHITDYAVPLLGLSVVVALLTHRSAVFRRPGRALFAFSLIVLGLAIIGMTASHPFSSDRMARTVLGGLESENARLVLVVIGALLAVMLSSSAATIGLVLTLAASGVLKPVPALVLMLGANVGTTVIPMLSALSQGTLVGRRLALAYTGTKLLGAIFLLFLIEPVATLLMQVWPDAGTQVAMAHTGFNLALALVFVPLSGPLARLMERLLVKKEGLPAREEALVCILDRRALTSPSIAQGLATRETLHMADIVTAMLELSMQAFEGQPDAIKTRINAMDDQLDDLNAAIKGYLTQLDEEAMTEEQQRLDITLLTIIGDLEAMGDVITIRGMNLAHRRSRDRVVFSEEGWSDLLGYHQQIRSALQHVMAALAAHNPVLATNFLAHKAELKWTRRNLHLRHIRELRANIPNSMTSSAIYLDLLDVMTALLSRISNIAHAIEEVKVPSTRSL